MGFIMKKLISLAFMLGVYALEGSGAIHPKK